MREVLANSILTGLILVGLLIGENRAQDRGLRPGASGSTQLPVSNGGPLLGDSAENVVPESPSALANRIPPFHLTRVDLDGEVLNDRAAIEAHIEIAVNLGEGWHRVPLRLNQAYIWGHTYEGPGSEAPDVDSGSEGLVWLVKGIGVHRLNLSLRVPLRRALAEEQLQLTLPVLPPQFESTLRLRLPGENLSLRPSRETTILESSVADNMTTITGSVSGNRLDLAWKQTTGRESAAAQARSTLSLRRNGNRIGLLVDQTIQFDAESPEQIRVRLPADFRVVEVQGSKLQGDIEWDEAAPGWGTLRLADNAGDRVDLKWQLDAELPVAGRSLTVDGFEIDRAITQDGVIRIEDFSTYQVKARSDDSQLVERIDTAAVRGAGPATIVSAFGFPKQPFVLQLELTPVKPSFAVIPEHDLFVGEDSLTLGSRFQFDVDSGALPRVVLDWPFASGAWNIQSLALRMGNIDVPVSYSLLSDSQLEVLFPSSMTGKFQVEVSAQRMYAAEPLRLELPTVVDGRQAPAWLSVGSDDRLETKLSVDPPGVLSAIPNTVPAESSVVLSQQKLRLGQGVRTIQLETIVHNRTVNADLAVHVEEVGTDSIRIRQLVDLDIRHGRLNSLLLNLPALLRQASATAQIWGLEVKLDGQRMSDLQSVSAESLLVTFPRDIRGAAQLELLYRLPNENRSDSQTRPLSIPVIQIDDATQATLRCVIHPLESVQVADGGWTPVSTAPEGAVWVAPTPDLLEVPVVVSTHFVDDAQQYAVDQAFLRTRFAENGQTTTIAAFRLYSAPQRVVLRFPKSAELDQAHLDQVQLASSDWSREPISETEDQITFRLPGVISERVTLQLQYHQSLSHGFGLANNAVFPFPYFPAGVWTDESLWEIELPAGQHLVQSPAGCVPEFNWTRTGIIWQRRLSTTYLQDRERWVQIAPRLAVNGLDRCYAFRQFGPLTQATFSSMNRSLILLVGAGTTLLLGFVFWKLPTTRNLMSVVSLAFFFAVASLWYLEPMLLLLQPAVFGLFLAVLATAIDAARRPQSFSPLLALEPSGEARRPAGGSSVTHVPTTLYRPMTTADPSGSQR